MFILVGLVISSLTISSIVTAVTTVNDAAKVKIYGSEVIMRFFNEFKIKWIQKIFLIKESFFYQIKRIYEQKCILFFTPEFALKTFIDELEKPRLPQVSYAE